MVHPIHAAETWRLKQTVFAIAWCSMMVGASTTASGCAALCQGKWATLSKLQSISMPRCLFELIPKKSCYQTPKSVGTVLVGPFGVHPLVTLRCMSCCTTSHLLFQALYPRHDQPWSAELPQACTIKSDPLAAGLVLQDLTTTWSWCKPACFAFKHSLHHTGACKLA